MLEVEVNPADVVAIPVDYNEMKCRCCKYIVRAVVANPLEENLFIRSSDYEEETNEETYEEDLEEDSDCKIGKCCDDCDGCCDGCDCTDIECERECHCDECDECDCTDIECERECNCDECEEYEDFGH